MVNTIFLMTTLCCAVLCCLVSSYVVLFLCCVVCVLLLCLVLCSLVVCCLVCLVMVMVMVIVMPPPPMLRCYSHLHRLRTILPCCTSNPAHAHTSSCSFSRASLWCETTLTTVPRTPQVAFGSQDALKGEQPRHRGGDETSR